jgi:membrane protein implicated in regulation of membrane protease activity
MKRDSTMLVLCGLLMFADWLCARQTFDARSGSTTIAFLLIAAAESAVFFAVSVLLFYLLRKTYRRQKRPPSRRATFAIVQPLRRLFVSVWL